MKRKCEVVNNIVTPCEQLNKTCTESGRLGISYFAVYNLALPKPKVVKSCYIVKSGDHKKNGIVLNYCPFCGNDIGTHMQKVKS